MLKSMTAYGRATVVSSLGRFSVEIQSVNRKHLEINTFIPSLLMRFDSDIKKWISAVVGRGQVNVRISVVFEKGTPLKVVPNLGLARQMQGAWTLVATELGLHLDDQMLLRALSSRDDLMLFDQDSTDIEEYKHLLQESVDKALEQLVAMKAAEGKALFDDISSRMHILAALIKEIAVKAPGATERYRLKLQERLQELLSASAETEERLLREVCLYAEKIDIAEELTRFDSHLHQANMLLKSSGQGIGKTLEFVVQELNREANTIGSKSSDVDVSKAVIGIKSELERIREQIQNIE